MPECFWKHTPISKFTKASCGFINRVTVRVSEQQTRINKYFSSNRAGQLQLRSRAGSWEPLSFLNPSTTMPFFAFYTTSNQPLQRVQRVSILSSILSQNGLSYLKTILPSIESLNPALLLRLNSSSSTTCTSYSSAF